MTEGINMDSIFDMLREKNKEEKRKQYTLNRQKESQNKVIEYIKEKAKTTKPELKKPIKVKRYRTKVRTVQPSYGFSGSTLYKHW
jgi:hypothetical protein